MAGHQRMPAVIIMTIISHTLPAVWSSAAQKAGGLGGLSGSFRKWCLSLAVAAPHPSPEDGGQTQSCRVLLCQGNWSRGLWPNLPHLTVSHWWTKPHDHPELQGRLGMERFVLFCFVFHSYQPL